MTTRSICALGATMALLYPLLPGCQSLRSHKVSSEASAVATTLIKSTNSWDGNLLPEYPQQQPEVTILRLSIPAGARLRPHIHPVINAGVLISGELTVVATNGATLRLKAGDPIVEVVNTVHYSVNEGNAPAEIIVFYAGAAGQPITVVEEH